MADDMLVIADDSTKDYVERQNKDGSTYTAVDHDHIARARLRVDTRKWLLAKALPKLFGDKVIGVSEAPGNVPEQLREVPRDPVKDHLEGLSKRFANGLKLIERGATAKPNGSTRPVSDAALNAASAEWYRKTLQRRDD
jgi:hypothetical protein